MISFIGFREKPGPRWPSDKRAGDEILEWSRKRTTVTDQTADMLVKANGKVDVVFSFALQPPDGRPVEITKLANVAHVQFGAAINPSPIHVPALESMSDDDYRALQDEISFELVKFGVSVISQQRLVAGRGPDKDADGDEIQPGIMMIEPRPLADLSEREFVETLNFMRRAVAMVQTIVRKHVRLEDARRGRETAPEQAPDVPTLSVASTEAGEASER